MQVFNNEFGTEIDEKGMVTDGDMRVFLDKIGISEKAIRFFIDQMDWQNTAIKIVMIASIRIFLLKKNPHQPLRLVRVLIGGPNDC